MRKQEIGSASFARGYRLVPMAEGDTPIRPEWIRFWNGATEYDRVVLAVDPAVSVRAKADASALVVLGEPVASATGVGGDSSGPEKLRLLAQPARQFHILEAVAKQVPAPELVSLIDDFDRRWKPEVILFETNAAFLGIKDLMVRHARYGPRVKGVNQSTDKAARVAAFSVSVENGTVRLKGRFNVDEGQRELWDQMILFPYAEHDDLVDAAAMGAAFLLDRREPRVWLM